MEAERSIKAIQNDGNVLTQKVEELGRQFQATKDDLDTLQANILNRQQS